MFCRIFFQSLLFSIRSFLDNFISVNSLFRSWVCFEIKSLLVQRVQNRIPTKGHPAMLTKLILTNNGELHDRRSAVFAWVDLADSFPSLHSNSFLKYIYL